MAALAVMATDMYAQTRKVQNKPYIDNRRFHYGFLCTVHSQSMSFENNGHINETTGEQWYAANDRGDIGFSIGVLGEWRLNKYFALRTTPTISFGQKHFTFREQVSGKEVSESMKSTLISVPADIKFSALRFNNHRPYLLAGLNATYDLTSHKQDAIEFLMCGATAIEIGTANLIDPAVTKKVKDGINEWLDAALRAGTLHHAIL